MTNNSTNFTWNCFRIISSFFLIFVFSSCSSLDTKPSGNALTYVEPLIQNGVCGNGKGLYNKVKNSHDSKNVVVTIETDMSPDPNNWYPSQRDFNLKPRQIRILGCSIVDEGSNKKDSHVFHKIVNARFQ